MLRFVTPSGDPPYQLTLAVTKRALTPALQAAAIIALVEQLVVSGALDAGQAKALTKKLENAIALLEIGDDARLHPDGPEGHRLAAARVREPGQRANLGPKSISVDP